MSFRTEYLVIVTPGGNDKRVSACINGLYHTVTSHATFTRKSGEPNSWVHYTPTPNPLIKRQWICPLRLSADVRRCPLTPKPPQLLTSLIPELSALVHSYSPSWLSVWLSRRFFIPAILEGAADVSIGVSGSPCSSPCAFSVRYRLAQSRLVRRWCCQPCCHGGSAPQPVSAMLYLSHRDSSQEGSGGIQHGRGTARGA